MFKKKIIRVEFIDSETGEAIGYDEQSVKKLPEAFEFKTTVEIGSEKYTVVKAEPDTRKKFKKSGTLVLELEKIRPEKKDPMIASEERTDDAIEYATILPEEKTYQAASKADLFPAFTGQKDDKDLAVMGAWEWRQVEFVSGELAESVFEEFSQIDEVRKKYSRQDSGRVVFSKQYRRSRISSPLQGLELQAAQLREEYFPFSIGYDGLTFMAADGIADGGFALRLQDGLLLYGLAFAGKVEVMSLQYPDQLSTGMDVPGEKLAGFMKTHNLILVDWERREVIRAAELVDHLAVRYAEKHEAVEEITLVEEMEEVVAGEAVEEIELVTESQEEGSGEELVSAVAEVVTEPKAEIELVEAEVEALVVEEPKAEEPVVEEAVAEEANAGAVVEEPKIEEPVAEEAVSEEANAEPVVEEPKVEEPSVEEPVDEEPKAETPFVEEAVAEAPKTEEAASDNTEEAKPDDQANAPSESTQEE